MYICIYVYIRVYTCIYVYIIYIYIYIHSWDSRFHGAADKMAISEKRPPRPENIRTVHLLRVSLLRVLESNFPGDSL